MPTCWPRCLNDVQAPSQAGRCLAALLQSPKVRHLMEHRSAAPLSIAFIVGVTLWCAASAISGRREPWDGAAYWILAYPIAILASAFLGYRYPQRPWRWAIVLFESQLLAMGIRNGELGNLWPIGMLAFAVIALPAVLAAQLASRRRTQ